MNGGLKGKVPILAERRRAKLREWIISLPTLVWFTGLFVIPTLLILALSFKLSDSFGTLLPGWSLRAWQSALRYENLALISRTLMVSTSTALICLCLGIPTVFYMVNCTKNLRFQLLLALIVPFWTSFLVRIFAWKYLLHPEGLIKQLLISARIIDATTPLLYSMGAVMIVMVYTFLPFAILPLFAAADKFELALLEAASDLGASRPRAFFTIFLPCIRKGIARAFALVFIPSLGSYVVPDLVGGVDSEILGNKILQRTLIDRNLPQASALSGLLLLLVLALYLLQSLGAFLARRLAK